MDSESLGNQVMADMAGELGLPLTLAEALALFRGRKMAECVHEIEIRIGRGAPEDFVPRARARMAAAFESELRAIDGIEEVLDAVDTPNCVASSGPHEKIRLTLAITGLLPRFDGRIFSAYDIGVWKPDPGLFLHAARTMGHTPAATAVIEDSVPGVQAGVAAGMTVFGFAGSGTTVEALAGEGAIPFSAMRELPGLLAAHSH